MVVGTQLQGDKINTLFTLCEEELIDFEGIKTTRIGLNAALKSDFLIKHNYFFYDGRAARLIYTV